jgi:sorting nexin-29
LDFLTICWIYGHIPEEWRIAVVVPIYKKGDRKNCNNYRGISLLNTGYKIYAKIITQRVMTIAQVILLKEQNGFRRYRTCMGGIFSVSEIIEKHREYTNICSFYGLRESV